MKKVLGVYKAIVTDVSCFKTTGKIKTRISCLNNNSIPADLINKYDKVLFEKQIEEDRLTYIFMPFGGGWNYGMFKLPEVNSIGIVQFIDGNLDSPIWLGSFNRGLTDKTGNLLELGIPSDRINEENNSSFYKDESESGLIYDMENENSFIIKTKSNTLNDLSKPETMDWKKNKVDNTVVLNSSKAEMNHNIEEGKNYNISINKEDGIKISYIEEDNEKEIKINNLEISISSKAKANSFKANFKGDKFRIVTSKKINDSNIESIIEQKASKISLKSGDSSVVISNSIKDNELILSGKTVRISAKSILLGNSGYNLVACPNENTSITLEDGTLLTTMDNIKV